MNETKRKRLEKQILRLTAEITYRRLKNIELGFVTFTSCEISEDSHHVKIGVAVYGDKKESQASLKGLNGAAGFYRSLIGKNLALRNAPEIHFFLDTSYEKIEKINSLIDGQPPEDLE